MIYGFHETHEKKHIYHIQNVPGNKHSSGHPEVGRNKAHNKTQTPNLKQNTKEQMQ